MITLQVLIELLDQVEDAISVEDTVSGGMEACLSVSKDKNGEKMDLKVNPAVKGAVTNSPEMVNRAVFKPKFLVLEVCFIILQIVYSCGYNYSEKNDEG